MNDASVPRKCKHCGRAIRFINGKWLDSERSGLQDTCEVAMAAHEPEEIEEHAKRLADEDCPVCGLHVGGAAFVCGHREYYERRPLRPIWLANGHLVWCSNSTGPVEDCCTCRDLAAMEKERRERLPKRISHFRLAQFLQVSGRTLAAWKNQPQSDWKSELEDTYSALLELQERRTADAQLCEDEGCPHHGTPHVSGEGGRLPDVVKMLVEMREEYRRSSASLDRLIQELRNG